MIPYVMLHFTDTCPWSEPTKTVKLITSLHRKLHRWWVRSGGTYFFYFLLLINHCNVSLNLADYSKFSAWANLKPQ